jgi:hypothetical protein
VVGSKRLGHVAFGTSARVESSSRTPVLGSLSRWCAEGTGGLSSRTFRFAVAAA